RLRRPLLRVPIEVSTDARVGSLSLRDALPISERRGTVRSVSVVGVGELRGADSSTRGPSRTTRSCPGCPAKGNAGTRAGRPTRSDRKSTRLNSSHSQISYAVFCVKKKTRQHYT